MLYAVSILIVSMLTLLTGCTNGYSAYHNHRTITHEQGWHKDSILFFHATGLDSTASYNGYVEVRNNNFYPFSNLWLYYGTDRAEQHMLDTVNLTLAKPNGEWIGKGWGNYHLVTHPLFENITPAQNGSLTVHIRHGIRDVYLKGINSIGVRLEKNEHE